MTSRMPASDALSRKTVADTIGGAARSSHRGRRPLAALLCMVLLHETVPASPADAAGFTLSTLGIMQPFLPSAAAPQPSSQPPSQPASPPSPAPSLPSSPHPSSHHASRPAPTPPTPPTGIESADERPKLAPVPMPPDDQLPGSPSQWKIQSALKQLGFYHGPLDGGYATPQFRADLEVYLETIPDYLTRYVRLPFEEIVLMGLNNTVRLSLPADRTLAAPMSNLARANLNGNDLARLRAATERANAHPDQEQQWRSTDGRRGGTVVMSGAPNGPCGTFSLRVDINDATETAGPLEGCRRHGQWEVITGSPR